jgi:hypothetical protein
MSKVLSRLNIGHGKYLLFLSMLWEYGRQSIFHSKYQSIFKAALF